MTADARIVQGDGRAKAYRPIPAAERRRAIRAGLAAYRRGDFFEAHELLEPAWMGTRDLGEREALQALIKLAAAYVHAVRGNAAGVAKNLDGTAARLAFAAASPTGLPVIEDVDLAALAVLIDAHRAALADAGRRAIARLDRAAILALVPPPTLEAAPAPAVRDLAS